MARSHRGAGIIAMAFYPLARKMLFALDPERAHDLVINAMAAKQALHQYKLQIHDPVLATQIGRLSLTSPVGLAAGFDKDGRAPLALLGAGFGFVEVGTLTPRAQTGNPKPRLFRLPEDQAVINRLGFNNQGQMAAGPRLTHTIARRDRIRGGRRDVGLIGVNIGANKDSEDRVADYAEGVARFSGIADYLTINISSPNTPRLRDLQSGDALENLLTRVMSARGESAVPIFVKIAPDIDDDALGQLLGQVMRHGVDGLIVSNTTIARPGHLISENAHETGGLSGEPLAPRSRALLGVIARDTQGKLPIISVGGVGSAEEAYARIKAGASAVQLYTALVYKGPTLAGEINRGLAKRLKRDGFSSVTEAVGSDYK
ncbi:MAG: quinone-dependent dihydroorotate dehydrogenase [Pseudomonadota bacterium]